MWLSSNGRPCAARAYVAAVRCSQASSQAAVSCCCGLVGVLSIQHECKRMVLHVHAMDSA
jgi:hypothetical protein